MPNQTQAPETRQPLEGLESFQQAMACLVKSARNRLYILTDRLDDLMFKDSELISALTRLHQQAKKRTDIRILIKDGRALHDRHNTLFSAARRLPTVVQVRQLTMEPENDHMNYVIGDQEQLIFRYDSLNFEGYLTQNDRPEIQALQEEFVRLWEQHSKPVEQLRQLHL